MSLVLVSSRSYVVLFYLYGFVSFVNGVGICLVIVSSMLFVLCAFVFSLRLVTMLVCA